MKKICDLHTHSLVSDGTYTPSEIINEAVAIGLSAVALCDHNTVDGIHEFLKAAEGKEIEAIAGAEFSVDYNGVELHLLGLFISEDKTDEIAEMMKEANRRKEESNVALVKSLNNAGYRIDYSEIKNKHPEGKVNRAHVAAELTEKGYTASMEEAFHTLLAKGFGHYVEPERIKAFDMIRFLHSIGAVPVLAHPFLNLSEDELIDFLPKAKECGLVGMECFYSTYSEEEMNRSVEIAVSFNLMTSGGSDFHGKNKPSIKLGFGKDNLSIPYGWAINLKTKAE